MGAQPAMVMLKFMCQGVANGLRTSSNERNSLVNRVMWCSRQRRVVQMRKTRRMKSMCQWNKSRINQNMRQSWDPVQYHHNHPVRAARSQCK